MKIEGYVAGVGILGPGLADWENARAVLSGQRAYQPAPTLLPPAKPQYF